MTKLHRILASLATKREFFMLVSALKDDPIALVKAGATLGSLGWEFEMLISLEGVQAKTYIGLRFRRWATVAEGISQGWDTK